jgi:hypothetical protein
MQGRKITGIVMAAALVVAVAAPASAGGADVKSGEFVTLAGGASLGYEVSGHAVMRRVPGQGGKTIVTVHLSGLDVNTTYPTHVHNASCDGTPAGGGHYQHLVGGSVDPVNEIWPVVVSNAAGQGLGTATHNHWARPDAMAVVVHYPADTSIRLACVDLR